MRLVNRKYGRRFGGGIGYLHRKLYFVSAKRGYVDSFSEPIGQWDMTFSYPKTVRPWWDI